MAAGPRGKGGNLVEISTLSTGRTTLAGENGKASVRYSAAFKNRVLQKMLAPNAPSAYVLARELGVSQVTLLRWRARARTLPAMTDSEPKQWSLQEKLRVVVAASQLSDKELGAFLRREGLHEEQLEEWREAVETALGNAPKRNPKNGADARRIKELEKELRRKDKALAETAALLVLAKKVEALWGDVDDDTDEKSAK